MIVSDHGLSIILWMFLGFAGSLVFINALIDIGWSRFRIWFGAGCKTLSQFAFKRPGKLHGRVVAPRLR